MATSREADFLTLNCPLNPETHHIIDAKAIAQMKATVGSTGQRNIFGVDSG